MTRNKQFLIMLMILISIYTPIISKTQKEDEKMMVIDEWTGEPITKEVRNLRLLITR